MLLASALAAAGFVWWITAGVAMVFPPKRAAAFRMILAILITWGVNEFALKPLFDRQRPFASDAAIAVIDAKPTTPSFPSSDAAMAVAGGIAGARMLPWSAVVWSALAVLVAVSRVYVGVHWPSDVVMGALIGFATAWFVLGGRTGRPRN